MKSTGALPHDALREALGQVIANERREWRREREVIEAQSREAVAELRARIVELEHDVRGAVSEHLAAVKDGESGARGDIGPEGPRGLQGEPGAAGEAGRQGNAGERGIVGTNGLDGAPGPPGERGAEGAAGRNGIDGKDGADGASGRDGNDGKDGAPGADGADGAPGRDGANGAAGIDGKDGLNGADGVPGVRGADGVPGRDGVDGLPGKDGAPGRDGERGVAGPPGSLPIAREWTDEIHYEAAVVTHAGASWQATKNTAKEPPHADWRCLAVAGRDGADGRSFTVRGTWNETGKYSALDVVALGGASFVAKRDQPGQCPGEGWQLAAAQGKRGNQGDRGPAGPKGDRGEPGLVIAADVDNDGLLTLTNGDGSVVTCDLYPLLSRALR